MTTLLNEVLQYHIPDTWDGGSYANQRYRCIQVVAGHNPHEYNEVVKEFPASLKSRIISVYRVQNPYMYGRFRLRIEQLQTRGESVFEERWYHPIAESHKVDVMEYNCDYRRYANPNCHQYENKRPLFYRKPLEAVQLFRSMNNNAVSLVVMQVVSTICSGQTRCTKDWDTEYYPAYIVDLDY